MAATAATIRSFFISIPQGQHHCPPSPYLYPARATLRWGCPSRQIFRCQLSRFLTGGSSGEGDPFSSSVMKMTFPRRSADAASLGRALEDRGHLFLRHGQRFTGHPTSQIISIRRGATTARPRPCPARSRIRGRERDEDSLSDPRDISAESTFSAPRATLWAVQTVRPGTRAHPFQTAPCNASRPDRAIGAVLLR